MFLSEDLEFSTEDEISETLGIEDGLSDTIESTVGAVLEPRGVEWCGLHYRKCRVLVRVLVRVRVRVRVRVDSRVGGQS